MKSWVYNKLFLLSLLLFIISRIYFIYLFNAPFNADEAVFGLMGKYISECKDFPIFMWQAHYSGTISSYVFAIFIKIFGFKPILLKIVMVLWEIMGVLFFSLIFKHSLMPYLPLFLIMPFKHTFLFTSYIESFSFAFASFYILKKIYYNELSKKALFLVGFLNGFGIYHHPIFIPFFITSVVMSFKFLKEFKNRIYFESGFIVGISPLIVYNLFKEFATVGRFGGIILSGTKSSVNLKVLFENIFDTFNFPFILVILFSLIVLFYFSKNDSFNKKLFFTLFVVSFIFYFFPGIRKARYLMPFFYASVGLIAVSLEYLKVQKNIFFLLLSFVLIVSIYNFFTFVKTTTYPDFKSLISFLNEKQIKYSYSDYWTAYPITFLSNKDIIVSPRMNDRMGFYDRTPNYYQKVKNQENKCFIIPTKLYSFYDKLVMRLEKMKIKFRKYEIAGYYVIVFNYDKDDFIFL